MILRTSSLQCVTLPVQLLAVLAISLPLRASSAELPSAAELVPLRNGVNKVDFGHRAIAGMVVLAHRENFNAHSSEIATFYLRTAAVESDPKAWQIVPFEVTTKDGVVENHLRVWGGADCQLETFRLLRGRKDRAAYVLKAERPLGESFIEPAFVTFTWFKLHWNLGGIPGWSTASFKPWKTEITTKRYCDVDKAIGDELQLKGAFSPKEGSLPDDPEE